MKRFAYIVLGILLAVQLAVIAMMISSRERTLKHGEAFNFITRPIDPVDVFQGRYVRLAIRENRAPMNPKDVEKVRNVHRYTYLRRKPAGMNKAYITIANDTNGFAYLAGVSFAEPMTNIYFATEDWWYGGAVTSGPRQASHTVVIKPPFERFYMDEVKAPETERKVRNNSSNCWVKVRILDGKTVIENLFIDGGAVKE